MISEFPLFVFTTLAGLAAGAYIASAIFVGTDKDAKHPWLFPLVCIVLLGAGLLGCLGHLGRPTMFLNALGNPSSMIAQEAYWSIAFGVVLLIDVILCFAKDSSPRALRVVGAVAAAGLIVVMGNAYFTGYGVVAWTSWATWPLYLVGDLAMGAALLGVFRRELVAASACGWTAVVLDVLFAATAVVEAVTFSGLGNGFALFIVAAVVSAVGAVAAFLGLKGKLPAGTAAVVACAAMIAAVACARYCFYAERII